MSGISFAVNAEAMHIIFEIADRAVTIAGRNGIGSRVRKQDVAMSVTACHANGCPLDLVRLLKADDGNFAHDVFGICRHINTKDGSLNDGFSPRYQKRN